MTNAIPPHHAALKINNIRIMFRRVAPYLGGLIVSAIGGAISVWLNTPLYPLEASGTSGMKAGINGVMNFSILDGWWAAWW